MTILTNPSVINTHCNCGSVMSYKWVFTPTKVICLPCVSCRNICKRCGWSEFPSLSIISNKHNFELCIALILAIHVIRAYLTSSSWKCCINVMIVCTSFLGICSCLRKCLCATCVMSTNYSSIICRSAPKIIIPNTIAYHSSLTAFTNSSLAFCIAIL